MQATKKQTPAFHHVRETADDVNGKAGFEDTDLIFLKGLMDSPIMKSLVKMQDKLEDGTVTLEPVGTGNVTLLREISELLKRARSRDALELARLLRDPNFKSMLDAHDTVASKSYERPKTPSTPNDVFPPVNGIPADAIRMVGIRKNPHEPLGVTVKIENGELVIARILGGGMIDRQGLLRVGDIIKEVNGTEVFTPEQLQEELRKSDGTVNFKIVASYTDYPAPTAQDPPRRKGGMPTTPRSGRKKLTSFSDNIPTLPLYVKALYNYDPMKDTLLPCSDIGLAFKQGDILQVLNRQDPNWWQARKIGSSGMTGLIPSQELEERRKAFVRPEFDYATKTSICGTRMAKKKKKQMYHSKQNAEFDKAELVLYEEVARMPPFRRKSLVIIGAQSIGRRSLKSRIVASDPERFGTVIPYTSRPLREGEDEKRAYIFTSVEQMDEDIAQNKYLEHGEYNGHLYGTKLDSIRAVIKAGKMCVLDCNPQGLKTLNSPEFMPYVIFIATPTLEQMKQGHDHTRSGNGSKLNLTFDRVMNRQSRRARTLESLSSIMEEEDMRKTIEESSRLQRAFEKFFDLVIVNEDLDQTYEKLIKAINSLSTEPQWVPVSWVY